MRKKIRTIKNITGFGIGLGVGACFSLAVGAAGLLIGLGVGGYLGSKRALKKNEIGGEAEPLEVLVEEEKDEE